MMPDREKYIEVLSKTAKKVKEFNEDAPIKISLECIEDILELLKEQEAVEPFHRCIGKDFSLVEDSHFNYCPYCGKPITWAKQEGR